MLRFHGVKGIVATCTVRCHDLITPYIKVIRAMPHIARRKENAHAHKTKRGEEKVDPDTEIKIGW